MRNRTLHLELIETIAAALGELNEKVAFVGGAVVGLYTNDLAAEDVRPTKDIDITLHIVSLGNLELFREALLSKGFIQHADDDVVCRFRYEGILVDVMATHPVGWAPANRWFAPGFDHLISRESDGQTFRLLSLPYFMATKFDAHADRGGSDPRTSKDFEDIVYLLDYVVNLDQQISAAPEDVKTYLIAQFEAILTDNLKKEAILAQLPYSIQMERFKIIMDKIETVVTGNSK